ncbi:RNA 2',3'-cyclic phosphodiesterase [Cribrihabitans pelagius]|uniref:RNA 2',3'-cyclic phosphodiesterase n=1 Tax=Cribrihabitans pelagius TaxID=1765746 RepID=UPI003B592862
MRAFAALPLPDQALDALERVQEGLTVGRLMPAENLHLTLAFLDDQPEAALEALHQELAEIRAAPVDLSFQGLDTFGGRHPRILLARAAPSPGLTALRTRILSACRAAEIALDRARFRPHVTLARFPRHLEPGQVAKIGRFLERSAAFRHACRVESFALFRSTLAPDGARHDVLAEYPLNG